MSLFCVHFAGVFLLILDLCQAAFRNNKDADTVGFSNQRWESQTKIKNDTFFFVLFFLSRRRWKHSLWEPSAMMRNTAITLPWERWNLIRSERLQKRYFYPHQSCEGSTRLVSRQALVESSVSGLSAVLGLSWVPPAWREGMRSPQPWGVCSSYEVGSGGPKLLGGGAALTLWGLYVTLKIYGSPTAVKTSVLSNKERKRKNSREISDLDLLHVQYVYILLDLSEEKQTHSRWSETEFQHIFLDPLNVAVGYEKLY